MKLTLDKVGIIDNSSVLIDGLTVVTGINSSGKTTVGRVLYSVISALGNAEYDYEKARRDFVIYRLNNIHRAFGFVQEYGLNYLRRRIRVVDDSSPIFHLAVHNYIRFDIDRLFVFFNDLHSQLLTISRDEFADELEDKETGYSFYSEAVSEASSEEDFLRAKQEALKIWDEANNTLRAPNSYTLFVKENIKEYLNFEFHNQIKPIKAHNAKPKIKLIEDKTTIVDFRIENKNDMLFSEKCTLKSFFTNSIFIDNPFIIDNLYESYYHRSPSDYRIRNQGITNQSIESHDKILARLIRTEKENFFENVDKNNRLKEVFEKINTIVPGEFAETSDGFYYVDEGARLSVSNLAAGSKMFFIIKRLLFNGTIDEKTILVLDEPESHLHPEWINKFAEILVLLIRELKVRILLTTHSPNLMLALNYYAKKSSISKNAHFYMAERDGYYSKIKCIDDNIGEGYSHLSLPLIEMNLMMNALDEK